jgi:predicted nucleotide-binding protein (sugar kinase/HSP70/actin superfamily)
MDFLPIEDGQAQEEQSQTCWQYGQKILAAAHFIKKHPQLKAIYLTNFGCGPDSFITHFFKTTLKGEPSLVLEIDEHSADTGAITRLEAFFDSLPNARNHQKKNPSTHRSSTAKIEDRTLYIPSMSDHAHAMAAAFNACGIDARVMPESDSETLYWGTKVTSGRECYPCILTTGDIVKVVKSPGFDPDRSAFFMPSGRGPCRFGQYNRFHRQVLDEQGYPDIPVFAPVQDEKFYESFNGFGKELSHMAWQGIVAVDLLAKQLLRIRPYEAQPGAAEAVYGEFLQRLCETIKNKQKLEAVLRESRKAFAAVSVENSSARPLVGIVGEIYIRANRFGNENLIKKVEELGGEALLAPVSEWILYTNNTAKEVCRVQKKFYQLFKLRVKDMLQKHMERCLQKIFYDGLHHAAEPSIEELLQHAQPYLDASFEGEAILSIGKSIDYLKRGVNGIITVMPFTCMPGTIVNAIMRRCRADYREFPLLNLAYDGQQETNAGIRLETFMHQVRTNKSGNV